MGNQRQSHTSPHFLTPLDTKPPTDQNNGSDFTRSISRDDHTQNMYATIEPRLIALLNNDVPSEPYSTSPSLELPPLHDPNILKASGRPLLLEPDASKRSGKHSPNPQLAPQHAALISSIDEDKNKSNGQQKKARIVADEPWEAHHHSLYEKYWIMILGIRRHHLPGNGT